MQQFNQLCRQYEYCCQELDSYLLQLDSKHLVALFSAAEKYRAVRCDYYLKRGSTRAGRKFGVRPDTICHSHRKIKDTKKIWGTRSNEF